MNKVVFNNAYGGFGLSSEATNWLKKRGLDVGAFWREGDVPRHHPLLIECVETFGSYANDEFSRLEIAEIEGDRYWILEYDGAEMVYTPETIPWVTIKGK